MSRKGYRLSRKGFLLYQKWYLRARVGSLRGASPFKTLLSTPRVSKQYLGVVFMTSSSKLGNYKVRLRHLQQQCNLKDYTIFFHVDANNETFVFKTN